MLSRLNLLRSLLRVRLGQRGWINSWHGRANATLISDEIVVTVFAPSIGGSNVDFLNNIRTKLTSESLRSHYIF